MISQTSFFFRPSVVSVSLRSRLMRFGLSVVLFGMAAGAHAQSLAFINGPAYGASTVNAGNNPGVITADVVLSGVQQFANTDTLQLAVTGGTLSAAVNYTAAVTGGVATFDLSPMYLLTGGNTTNVTYTFTLTDLTTTTTTQATATLGVTGNTVYVVTEFDDPATGTYSCNNANAASVTLSKTCTLRQAISDSNGTQNTSTYGVVFSTIPNSVTYPQTITLTSALTTLKNTTVLAGPGPQNVLVSGAATYVLFKENTDEYTVGINNLFTVSGLTLENGTGANGGAIYLGGAGSVTNVAFVSNTSTGTGGTIYVTSAAASTANLTITNCSFLNNSTPSAGGALSYNPAGAVTVKNSYFSGNTAGASGGALYINGGTGLTLINSVFTGNTATTNGGAVNAAASALTNLFVNDTFYNNSAGGTTGGGAIYLNGSASPNFSNSTLQYVTIVGNKLTGTTAGSGGGVYSASDDNITITDSVISDNSAAYASGNADLYYSTTAPATHTIAGSIYTAASGSSAYTSLAALGLTPALSSYGNVNRVLLNPGDTSLSPIPTFAIFPGSVLLKNNSAKTPAPISTVTTDGRGFARPSSGSNTVDIGAIQDNLGLAFTTEPPAPPASYAVSTPFSPAPAVTLNDSNFALPDAGYSITLSLTNGTLAGTPTATTSASGVATFSSVNSATAEHLDTLTAATTGHPTTPAPGTLSVTSTAFNIAGPTSQLAFGTPPANSVAAGGNAGSAITVMEEDSLGSTNSGTDTITLTVTYPNSTQQIYTATATAGVATFNLSTDILTAAGTYTYTATVSSSTDTPAVATETVTAAVTTQLAVSASSYTVTTAVSIPLTVTAEDTYGNPTTFSGTVTLSSTDPSAALSGPTALTNGSGSFTVNFSTPGTQTVTATSGSNTGTSPAFNVTADTPSLTLGSSGTPANYGTPVTFTASLSPSSAGINTTNGEIITFYNGGVSIGTGTLSFGSATLVTSSLPGGPNSITASYPGDGSLNTVTSAPFIETITSAGPSSQTITFPAPPSPVQFGNTAPITLTATADSGLTVIYTINSGPGVINGNILTAVGPGAIIVTATQPGNSNYTAATPVSQTVIATPATFTAAGFSTQAIAASTTQSVTLNFNASFTLGTLTVASQGASGTPFTITTGGTCTTGNPYTSGSSCTVNLTYTPTGPGVITGTVEAFDNTAAQLLQAASNAIATRYP